MAKPYTLLAACSAHHCHKVLEWFLADPDWYFVVLETPSPTDFETWLHRRPYDGVLVSSPADGLEAVAVTDVLGRATLPEWTVVVCVAAPETEAAAGADMGIGIDGVLDANGSADAARRMIRQAVRKKNGATDSA